MPLRCAASLRLAAGLALTNLVSDHDEVEDLSVFKGVSASHRLAAHRGGEATDELTRARRQIRLKIARQQLKQMSGRALTLTDVVTSIWILHHRELLPVGNQGIDKDFSSFV